ncbi:MAG: hypothetical protein KGL46_13130 [Hyphomicrobiales bacterium]|nr:hypothetical protein [Hyphomicrobiales bacterium]
MAARSKTYKTLCEYLGEPVTARICSKIGGTRIYIPKKREGVEIDSLGHFGLLDAEEQDLLCEYFAGEKIDVPKQPLARKDRTDEILRLLRAGKTKNEIACITKCTSRWVSKVARDRAVLSPQKARTPANAIASLSIRYISTKKRLKKAGE